MAEDDRMKKLEIALKKIHKERGASSVNFYSQMPALDIEAIPTGSLGLDAALGIGGVPQGRIVEFYGHEGSSKTSLALSTVAQAQAMGKMACFIDVEHAVDLSYAANLGVDVDNLLFSQPSSGEEALNIAVDLIHTGVIDIMVVDSVSALIPQSEIDGEIGDVKVGAQARMMSQALRKLAPIASKTNSLLIFINQVRQKIGIMYGDPTVTSGGKALAFYSSVRIQLNRATILKQKEEPIGIKVRAKIIKNKVAPPHRQAEYDVMFGTGIDNVGEVLDFCINAEIIEKSGAWFKHNGETIGQGREATIEWMKSEENKELYARLEYEAKKSLGLVKDEQV